MGHTGVVMLLLVTMTQAQDGTSSPQKEPIREHIEAERMRRVQVASQYAELRRGTEEGFFIRAKIDSTGPGNEALYWGAPSPRNGRVEATRFEIESPKGLVAQAIVYGPVRKVRIDAGRSDFVMGPGTAEFHFRLWAHPEVAAGDYVLKGKLKFQPVSKSGISSEQELQFDVPVRVVERKTKVGKNVAYKSDMTAWDWTRLILLMPLAPFLLNCN
jgi:hypothetical protein